MKNITITLTNDQAKELASLLTMLTGRLQYRASKSPDGSLDDSWKFWNDISKPVSSSLGFEAWCEPDSKHLINLLS